MKKKILLFSLIAGLGYVLFTSESNGPGNNFIDATGADAGLGNPTGCSTGGSCHGSVGAANSGINISIELDSAGIPRHYYTPGITYTVKLTGTNNTTSTLAKFGFQMCAIKGVTPISVASNNAGTWSSTTPTGTHYHANSAGNFVVNLVEHSTPLLPTTGTGAPGSTIVESFSWTAPVAGTGTISFWAAVNAVNGDGLATTLDKWNVKHDTIYEGRSSVLSVSQAASAASFIAYPNPVVNTLNLQTTTAGNYSVIVYDMNGRIFANETLNGTVGVINTSGWAPGLYQAVVQNENSRQVIPVVKQ